MKVIEAIPSKSDAHRAVICAALSEMTSGRNCDVRFDSGSQDIDATVMCMEALKEGREDLYCGESGSTLRFLLPVAGALGRKVAFHRRGRLGARPLSPLAEELEAHGCILSGTEEEPLVIRGSLKPGWYRLPGNVSSQYISGLLFALPLLRGGSRILITGELESAAYVEMTLQTLKQFGITILRDADGFTVPGGQVYRAPTVYQVEGDWSNSCFWLAAGALTEGGICVKGLRQDSLQGDREILRLLRKFGADVKIDEMGVSVMPDRMWGIEINAAQIPDMVPVLAAVACAARGKTVIHHAERLRIKESDRLATVAALLSNLGVEVTEQEDGLIICGCGDAGLRGGTADGAGDHRIVMTAAILSLICSEKVILRGAEAVAKSYPAFFDDLAALELDNHIERK